MLNAQKVLERVATLTRLQSLDELERNLLQASQEFFSPLDLFLMTIDRRGDARSLRSAPSEAHHTDSPRDEQTLLHAAEVLHEAHHSRSICRRHYPDTGLVTAYPLIDSPPLRTGLVMVLSNEVTIDEEITAAQHLMLDIFRNFGELLDNAQRDELTGLLNRKTFDDNMHRVISRSCAHVKCSDAEERRLQPASPTEAPSGLHHHVAMVDIDRFKSINDNFGHLVGDEVILVIANLLRECIRDTDLIYRFGGEEFVIILTGVDREGASAALERLRETLGSTHIPRAGHVTISYGLAQVEPGVQAHQLLDRADSALYFAKQNGRNQGHFYEDLLAAGKIEAVADTTGDVELF